MSLAINAADIAIVTKNHSTKLPSFAKRVSRRQFNKLMTQKTRTQKKRWADRSRSNARDMKRSSWEFTEEDQYHESMDELLLLCEELIAENKAYYDWLDDLLIPVALSPISSLDSAELTPVSLVRSPNLSPVILSRSPSLDSCSELENTNSKPSHVIIPELLPVTERIVASIGTANLQQLVSVKRELYLMGRGSVDAASSLTHEELKILFCFITSFLGNENMSSEDYANYLGIKVQQFINHFLGL
jgi:hypothetical protein